MTQSTDRMAEIMSRREPLCTELKACLWKPDGHGMTYIKHPLVNTLYGGDMVNSDDHPTNAYYNEQLKFKTKCLAELEAEEKWEQALWLVERPWRLQFYVSRYSWRMDPWRSGDCLLNLWSDSENPSADREVMLEYFAELAKASPRMRDSKKKLPNQSRLTIYRGTSQEEVDSGVWGMSWTLNKSTAEWFAKRFSRGNPVLVSATIRKTDAYAYINNRNEQEVVVNPNKLQQVQSQELS